ncbi:MAG: EAL domain-containing protein [Planctomycetes bacterium]|nr:EAL domain-containing protein [Planctomycetota bacterium]
MVDSQVPFDSLNSSSPDLARPTILLVEDDAEVRAAFRAALGKEFEIFEAEDGQYALGILTEHLPDLIVSDITMPGLDGVSLLREIRARDLDIPVILVTGEPELDGAVQAVEYGALRYLEKPIDPGQLRELAEQAVDFRRMANAKRDLFRMTSGTQGTASDRAGQLTRFESALDSIYLHFQPIYSLEQGTAIGYECLLRCAEETLRQPPALIQAGEELGRTSEIGRAIRAAALEKLAEVPEHAYLFVNLHFADLDDADLFDADSAFSQQAHRFVLEITERESLEVIANAQDKVQQLRELGFQIAMDDLGAGHNGLAAFAQLAPEVVKLDMRLVRDLDQGERQRDLVRVMHDFCAVRGMHVVAEGVETREELDALMEIGVDLIQGYYIARPHREVIDPPNPFAQGDGHGSGSAEEGCE